MATYKIKPSLPPPMKERGVIRWIKINLLSSTSNILLSIISLYLIYSILPPLLNWVFFDATWTGSQEEITKNGARWIFIIEKFNQFIYGFYPTEAYWRANTAFLLFFVFIGISKLNIKYIFGIRILLLFSYPVIAFTLIYGGFGLDAIPTNKWGGLLATLSIALGAIALSFPLGLLLALGRTSDMPIIRFISIIYIEAIRGIPLITVLFMASLMFPLFLPEGMEFDKLLRALIGLTLFQASYIAEIIRGGLNGVNKGQYEAASSIGFGYWGSMILIILPQALKISIPNIVGASIALFKDTSLLLIIGIFDILSMVSLTTSDANWMGFAIEGYVFVAIIYWIFCFSMSLYSQKLEKRFNTELKIG